MFHKQKPFCKWFDQDTMKDNIFLNLASKAGKFIIYNK